MVIKALEEHCVISYFEVAVSRGPSLAWVASLLCGRDCECVLSDEKTAFTVELPDRESRVRESSRTGSGTAPEPGPGQLSARPGEKETSLLLNAGR